MTKYLKAWAYGIFTQEAHGKTELKEEEAEEDTKGLTLINSINVFNNLSRLAMLWTVRHR